MQLATVKQQARGCKFAPETGHKAHLQLATVKQRLVAASGRRRRRCGAEVRGGDRLGLDDRSLGDREHCERRDHSPDPDELNAVDRLAEEHRRAQRREHGLAEHEHRRRRHVDVCVCPRHEAMARGARDQHEQHQPQPSHPVHRPEVLAGEQCDRGDSERGDQRHRGEVFERSDSTPARLVTRKNAAHETRLSTASKSPAVERFPLDLPAITTTTTPVMASAEQTSALRVTCSPIHFTAMGKTITGVSEPMMATFAIEVRCTAEK